MPEFNISSDASLHPGRCAFCADFQGPFIDTGIEFELEGRIYLCAPTDNRAGCVGQMASLIGWIPGEMTALLQEEIEDLRRQLATERAAERVVQIPQGDLERFVNRERNRRYREKKAEEAKM